MSPHAGPPMNCAAEGDHLLINNASLLSLLQLLLNDTDGASNFSGIFEAQGPPVSYKQSRLLSD